MAQYIDKSALVARIKKLKMDIGNIFNEYDEGFWEGRTTAFNDVICELDTLEVKEVDLKEEVERFAKECGYKSAATIDFQFAKHFFELGLNARLTEKKISRKD